MLKNLLAKKGKAAKKKEQPTKIWMIKSFHRKSIQIESRNMNSQCWLPKSSTPANLYHTTRAMRMISSQQINIFQGTANRIITIQKVTVTQAINVTPTSLHSL